MIGKTISSYKLIEVIGIGGMSTVYLGRHAKTGSIAAIKVLKEQYTQEEDHVKKFFIREIEVTKKLNHKNIVKLLNYGKKNGKYYLVYEYIDG
nr:protein kinase [Actinomycetota bacterium]